MDTITDNTSGMKRKFKPADCPHCAYDRKFPETITGGWIYMGNNGPIVSCPMCNADESHPRYLDKD